MGGSRPCWGAVWFSNMGHCTPNLKPQRGPGCPPGSAARKVCGHPPTHRSSLPLQKPACTSRSQRCLVSALGRHCPQQHWFGGQCRPLLQCHTLKATQAEVGVVPGPLHAPAGVGGCPRCVERRGCYHPAQLDCPVLTQVENSQDCSPLQVPTPPACPRPSSAFCLPQDRASVGERPRPGGCRARGTQGPHSRGPTLASTWHNALGAGPPVPAPPRPLEPAVLHGDSWEATLLAVGATRVQVTRWWVLAARSTSLGVCV